MRLDVIPMGKGHLCTECREPVRGALYRFRIPCSRRLVFACADCYERTVTALPGGAEMLGPAKLPQPPVKRRKCLRCSEGFEHRFNRICEPCTMRNSRHATGGNWDASIYADADINLHVSKR